MCTARFYPDCRDLAPDGSTSAPTAAPAQPSRSIAKEVACAAGHQQLAHAPPAIHPHAKAVATQLPSPLPRAATRTHDTTGPSHVPAPITAAPARTARKELLAHGRIASSSRRPSPAMATSQPPTIARVMRTTRLSGNPATSGNQEAGRSRPAITPTARLQGTSHHDAGLPWVGGNLTTSTVTVPAASRATATKASSVIHGRTPLSKARPASAEHHGASATQTAADTTVARRQEGSGKAGSRSRATAPARRRPTSAGSQASVAPSLGRGSASPAQSAPRTLRDPKVQSRLARRSRATPVSCASPATARAAPCDNLAPGSQGAASSRYLRPSVSSGTHALTNQNPCAGCHTMRHPFTSLCQPRSLPHGSPIAGTIASARCAAALGDSTAGDLSTWTGSVSDTPASATTRRPRPRRPSVVLSATPVLQAQ